MNSWKQGCLTKTSKFTFPMEQLLASFKIAPHLCSAVSTCSDRYVPSFHFCCLPTCPTGGLRKYTHEHHPSACVLVFSQRKPTWTTLKTIILLNDTDQGQSAGLWIPWCVDDDWTCCLVVVWISRMPCIQLYRGGILCTKETNPSSS